jgi:hypothetical protein
MGTNLALHCDPCLGWSIVVASLEEINRRIGNPVNQTMFLGETPGPTACKHKSERLGLAWAFEWIACFAATLNDMLEKWPPASS